eukprot:1186548-Prorocentrum_minimum.AAC.1
MMKSVGSQVGRLQTDPLRPPRFALYRFASLRHSRPPLLHCRGPPSLHCAPLPAFVQPPAHLTAGLH